MARPIVVANLDKPRPALVLTRAHVRDYLSAWTIAPILSRVRDLPTEVRVGPANGIDHESVISLDNIETVPRALIGRVIGQLLPEQEAALAEAVRVAFDLVERGRPA
jgi:mRNA interferase MazF